MIQKITAFFMTLISVFCSIFGIPYYPVGDKIDMDRFELVWCDEFDGESVDEDIWRGHYVWHDYEIRRGGYWDKKMATVKDGCLTIKTEYFPDGLDGGPAGYYTYGMDTGAGYRQTYGYFETRCILPKGNDLWSAFWIYCDEVAHVGNGGTDGAEIDVYESMYWDSSKPNTVSSNIHYDGYKEDHKALGSQKYLIKGDPYSEFNTYGVEWNKDGYTFYINGTKSFSTDFGGASTVPEFLILSVEVGGNDGVASGDVLKGVEDSSFIVDYVRAYQYK